MLISIILLALIASGGLALTYLIADDESFLWRVSAGSIIGTAVFGLIAFVAACVAGFTTVILIASLVLTMLPLLLLRRSGIRKRFSRDWDRAKGTMQGASWAKVRRFAYYGLFFLVFWFFFAQTVYEVKDGIYTGGSRNLGDLPFHLGAIFSFTEGNNFPPINPSFAGAKFSYPFISDFLAACLMKFGAGFRDAMVAQNLAWAFALLVILERFAVRLTGSKLAGRIAPALLFFSGGFGFLWFFRDAGAAAKGVWDFLWNLPREYTIGHADEVFKWGNSMEVLFITQRGLLLGMPLTIIVLQKLWEIFASEKVEKGKGEKVNVGSVEKSRFPFSHFPFSPFLVGLIAGTLPLIHVHSLAVLFVVTVFLFAIRPEKWLEWVAFGVGVAVIAVPELAWTMTGSATETSKFFGWHFGWDKGAYNFFWFWFANTTIFIPLLLAGIGLYLMQIRTRVEGESAGQEDARISKKDAGTRRQRDAAKKRKGEVQADPTRGHIISLLLFYIPFAFLFLISNVAKFAPWEWDNIKILIYWFAGSIPLAAYALAWAWQRKKVWMAGAAVCFVILILSGVIDVWRTASGYVKTRVFDADAVAVAEQIKQRTAPNAMFLNAPIYNSAVVLAGRPSVMRYSGHLSSYGIDYGPREADVRRIYEGGGVAGINLEKYNVEYVLISPEEKKLKANEEFFKKYPVIAQSGEYRVYKIK